MQALASNGKKLIAGGYHGEVMESSDGGLTWTDSTFGSKRWISAAYPSPDLALLIGETGRVANRRR